MGEPARLRQRFKQEIGAAARPRPRECAAVARRKIILPWASARRRRTQVIDSAVEKSRLSPAGSGGSKTKKACELRCGPADGAMVARGGARM